MDLIVYHLTKCTTCKKAISALQEAGHRLTLIDVREPGLTEAQISDLLNRVGEKALNRGSMTWRNLSEAERQRPPEELMRDYPALMKRPAILQGDKIWTGWTKSVQSDLLG